MHDESRVVLLGDSMMEGLGVGRENRVSDLLEKKTDVEHLNFATSGIFGPIQQWLIYENLAQQFDHTAVYLFVFPTNDFVDNDPKKNNPRRYRPYFRTTQGEHKEIYYPVPFEERELERRSRLEAAFNGVTNRVRLVSAVRWAFDQVTYRDAGVEDTNDYSDYTKRDLADMLTAYRHIIELAGDRAVFLFLIPFAAEFATLDEESGYRSLPLASDLAKFADGFDNVEFLDLLKPMYRAAKQKGLTFADFTLGCDGHWGPLGNRIVADAIYDWLQNRNAHTHLE
jgi:lysophospholipase L1-like esterase